jgi:hypothetical protein
LWGVDKCLGEPFVSSSELHSEKVLGELCPIRLQDNNCSSLPFWGILLSTCLLNPFLPVCTFLYTYTFLKLYIEQTSFRVPFYTLVKEELKGTLVMKHWIKLSSCESVSAQILRHISRQSKARPRKLCFWRQCQVEAYQAKIQIRRISMNDVDFSVLNKLANPKGYYLFIRKCCPFKLNV